MSTHFCDGINEVTLINGVARLEFYWLQARRGYGSADPNAPPPTELMVALPVEGFLQVLSALEGFREKLLQDGVLTRKSLESPR